MGAFALQAAPGAEPASFNEEAGFFMPFGPVRCPNAVSAGLREEKPQGPKVFCVRCARNDDRAPPARAPQCEGVNLVSRHVEGAAAFQQALGNFTGRRVSEKHCTDKDGCDARR